MQYILYIYTVDFTHYIHIACNYVKTSIQLFAVKLFQWPQEVISYKLH